MPCTAGSMDRIAFPIDLAQARQPIRDASFVERPHVLKLPLFNRHDQFAELADANAVVLRNRSIAVRPRRQSTAFQDPGL